MEHTLAQWNQMWLRRTWPEVNTSGKQDTTTDRDRGQTKTHAQSGPVPGGAEGEELKSFPKDDMGRGQQTKSDGEARRWEKPGADDEHARGQVTSTQAKTRRRKNRELMMRTPAAR